MKNFKCVYLLLHVQIYLVFKSIYQYFFVYFQFFNTMQDSIKLITLFRFLHNGPLIIENLGSLLNFKNDKCKNMCVKQYLWHEAL